MEKALKTAKQYAAQIEKLISELRIEVADTVDKNFADPTNYGYSANLNHVIGQLQDSILFLRGEAK